MTKELQGRLRPVRRRQQLLNLFKCGCCGLLIGSAVGVVVAIVRMQGGVTTPWAAIGCSLLGLGGGLLYGWVARPSWKTSAEAVDGHYQLKDRSLTALEFSADDQGSVFRRLQVADALEHLDNIAPAEVVPYRIPRIAIYAGAAFLALLITTALPVSQDEATANVSDAHDNILTEAELLEETMLEELAELKNELSDKEEQQQLEELLTELEQLVEEMKEPAVDQREALAKLSEMQAKIAAAQAEFNMDAVDNSMQSMGEALAAASSMQSAAKALQEGDYKKAADDLESLDPTNVSRKEAKTVAKELKKVSKKMSDAQLGQLSQAASEMCEGLEEGDPSKCKGGACKLAKLSRKYSLRKSVGECLNCQLSRLAECKGNCNCNKNGGNAKDKSNKSSNNWGRGSTGNPLGDEATRIDSNRQQEKIQGTAGEGPSEREVSHSPEGREAATREYREVYKEYRKQTEEVLQSEALPLGHRQTIRRYFESIRPDNETPTESE